jgi:hypothetical protein
LCQYSICNCICILQKGERSKVILVDLLCTFHYCTDPSLEGGWSGRDPHPYPCMLLHIVKKWSTEKEGGAAPPPQPPLFLWIYERLTCNYKSSYMYKLNYAHMYSALHSFKLVQRGRYCEDHSKMHFLSSWYCSLAVVVLLQYSI